MDCQRAREELWPPERPRLHEAEIERAQGHLDSCEACRRYFEQDRALLDLYDRLRRQHTPIDVRERVFDALARERLARDTVSSAGGLPGRPRPFGLTVALAVSMAVLGLFLLRGAAPAVTEDPAIFAEDYLRRAVGEDQIVSSDPQEVRRFLQRELGMGLTPLQLAGLQVERAEVCLIRGRRGAIIVYRSEDGPISHYLIPWDGVVTRAPAVADYRDGSAVDRMPVVTWSTPQLEQALVGEVESRELLRLASLAAS